MSNLRVRTYTCQPIPEAPAFGVVIGTFGSPCYVALQLEAHRRFWSRAAVLVHDDSSEEKSALEALCSRYGASFVSTVSRRGHGIGDVAALVAGLDWARESGIDILLKVSRRYLIHHDWMPALAQLAYNTQYNCFSNACSDFKLPFRTECAAFHVSAWLESDILKEIRAAVADRRSPSRSLETWFHGAALSVHRQSAPTALLVREAHFPLAAKVSGYGAWPMLGAGRKTHVPGALWHDVDLPEAYYDLAQEWGLTDYSLEEFRAASSYSYLTGAPLASKPNSAPAEQRKSRGADPLPDLPGGFAWADGEAVLARLPQTAGRSDPLEAAIRARLARKIGREPFDLSVRLRSSTPFLDPLIRVRDYYDHEGAIDIRSPYSILEALVSPRSDDAARFIACRAQRTGGIVLAAGKPAPGLAAVMFQRAPHNMLIAVEDDSRHAAAAAASCAAYDNRLARYVDASGAARAGNLFRDVAEVQWPEIAVLVLNAPGAVGESLASLQNLIDRQRPEIVFYADMDREKTAKSGDDAAEVLDILGRFGYSVRCLNNDGTLFPFPPEKGRASQAVYANIAPMAVTE